MTLPYHLVNVLTGTRTAKILEDTIEYAHVIERASRPLLVIGPRALEASPLGKSAIEYAVEIARAASVPICATAHTRKKLLELGLTPESSYDTVEIINRLKDKDWRGVKKEGNHDLIIFVGIRSDFAEQGLSTLKHFAPHLRTLTLCPYYFPNADYSLPNLKGDKWYTFLESLVSSLKAKET